MRKYMVVVTCVAVLLAGALAGAQTKVDETRPLEATGTVEVKTIAGSVDVVGWDKDQVQITGMLDENVEKLEIEGDRQNLEISVEVKHDAHRNMAAELTINVPTGATVELSTVSADLSVKGVAGRAELHTVSGSITVADRPSSLEVESVSGDTRVAFAPDRSDLESVSGDIEVADGVGNLDASVVSGSVTVAGGQFDGASLESVSGGIHWKAAIAGRGPFEMESMSGSVVVAVPASVAADFEVSTFSGNISSELGPEPERTSKYGPGRELNFTAGAGGPRVSLSSFSGSVKITTR